MKTLKLIATAQPTLFTHDGMEYFLVEFKAVAGVTGCSHRDAKDALDAAGFVPAVIRGEEVLKRAELTGQQGWVTLFDCRPEMREHVGFLENRNRKMAQGLGLASADGIIFYHLDHGGGPSEYPALCWRKETAAK